jgi:hypothetical protein
MDIRSITPRQSVFSGLGQTGAQQRLRLLDIAQRTHHQVQQVVAVSLALVCSRRRAAEQQQPSDVGCKDVAPDGARLRGTTRSTGADGMNMTECLIGGCMTSPDAACPWHKLELIVRFLSASFIVRRLNNELMCINIKIGTAKPGIINT